MESEAATLHAVTLDGQALLPHDAIVLADLLDWAHAKNNPWHASLWPLREALRETGIISTDGRARTALIDILRTELLHRQQDAIAHLLQGSWLDGHRIASRCRSLWQILKRVKQTRT